MSLLFVNYLPFSTSQKMIRYVQISRSVYWIIHTIDVVIMKPEDGKTKNENVLPPPFDVEEVYGKILLVRMDENSEPQDFTLDEYNSFCIRDESIPI